MKLLLDQNLSFHLLKRLLRSFPESVHVRDIGLTQADDEAIWQFAREHNLTIISKDTDFLQRSLLKGAPPKVIWVRLGNATTDRISELLNTQRDTIHAFDRSTEASFLVLG